MFDSHFIKVFIAFIVFSVFSVCVAQTDNVITGKCGASLTFTFNPFSHILVINGTGYMYDFPRMEPEWFNYKSSIWAVVIDEGVTSVGEYAFQKCENLMTVILPSSIKNIKTSAFAYCSKLSSIEIPENVEAIGSFAFSDCLKLGSVTLPASLMKIDRYAFHHSERLSSIIIPSNVYSIEYGAFSSCDNLKNITVVDNNFNYKSFDGVLFDSDGLTLVQYPCGKATTYDIHPGTTEIYHSAFAGCNKLESVTIPSNTVTKIGSNAFDGCKSLKTVTLPDVKEISSYLFYECSSLNNVVIPSTVKSIGQYAFQGCESLTSISLPAALETINQGAFGSCNALEEIKVENGKYFKAVNGVLFDSDGDTLIQYPCGKDDSYDIPKDVTTIKSYAFYGCKNLASVSIPSNVETIGYNAFSGCGLTSVAIPENVGSIEMSTFEGCSSLESVKLKTGLKSINNKAFAGCSSLKNVTIPSSVTQIDGNVFSSCNSLEAIYVGEKNTKYSAHDGVLFDTDNTLVRYPCGKTGPYTIPNTVKKVGGYAFDGCENLQVGLIPDGVKTIGSGAFSYTNGFTTMTISSDVNSIQYNAFRTSTDLISVTYLGTSEPAATNRPFEGCDSLETVCVPSKYESTTFGDLDNICKSDTCKDLVSEINQCYEVTCVGGNAKVEKRENVTRWENRSNGCIEYSCDNNTGIVAAVKCGKDDVCIDGECVKFSELKKQGYSAVMDLEGMNEADVNASDVEHILSTETDPESDMKVGTVIGDDGSALSIVVNVPAEIDADAFTDSVGKINKEDCNYVKYRAFCFCNETRVIAKELDDFSGANRNAVISVMILAMFLFVFM